MSCERQDIDKSIYVETVSYREVFYLRVNSIALHRAVLRFGKLGCDILRVKGLADHVIDEHLTVLLQKNIVKGFSVVMSLLDVFTHISKVSSLNHLASV